MIGHRTVSIVCGAKNRTLPLTRSLDTWLACPEVDEVVLVDWSSDVPFHFQDPRVLNVRVNGQAYWRISKCHNLELDLASTTLILRLDADDCIQPNFFSQHPLGDDEFYCYNKEVVSHESDAGLSGVIYAPRCLFARVNGYNEHLVGYGCDDVDISERLSKVATRRDLKLSCLHHQAHSNEQRMVHDPSWEDGRLEIKNPWVEAMAIGVSMAKNHELSKSQPWTAGSPRTRWQMFTSEQNYMTVWERE